MSATAVRIKPRLVRLSPSGSLLSFLLTAFLALLLAGCDVTTTDTAADEQDDNRVDPGAPVRVTLGEQEMVIRYTTDTCEEYDLPDVYARAVRSPDGRLLLSSGNAPLNYISAGTDFDNLQRVCDQPVLTSLDDRSPESFRNQEWLNVLYREGDRIHALVHNEYHDPVAPNCRPGDTSPANPCWYNAITYAYSTDGGRTFERPDPPGHVVAAPPQPWTPESESGRAPGPSGYFEPSNIVRGPDDYYYVMFFAIPDPEQQPHRGTCIMRTRTLDDPSSWRGWDGSDFRLKMGSPYEEGASDGRACEFVAHGQIGSARGSLTWNHHLERFVLVSSGVAMHRGSLTCGTWVAVSPDLRAWTTRTLVRQHPLPHPPCQHAPNNPHGSLLYPSLIDHDSESDSFETTGRHPWLYFVRWNSGLDRDLLRVRLTLDLADGS